MSYYREQLEHFLKTVSVDADTVFDIGGAHYPIDKKRTKTWKVKNYQIMDLPEYDLDSPIEFKEQADVIFCLEVFEYLIVPTVAMENIAAALKAGGRAYVSFPLIYPWHNDTDYDSLRYTESGVRRLAKRAGLKIDKLHYRRTKTNTLNKYYAEDGMRAAKGKEHNITGYIFEFCK
jgi:SAM-dependent methyltransferase